VTELPIQRLRADSVLPERAYPGDAGLDLVAYPELQADLGAVVEQANVGAVREVAPGGIGRVQDAERLALALAQELHAREGGVGLEVARRGQQAERPFGGFGGLDGIFVPVGHWRHTLLGELLGIEFELA